MGFATPAWSQTAEEATTGEAIVVTGSRIASPNLEGASPVTVVSTQEIKNTGTTRVEDLMNSLPQVFAGQSSTVSNGASGTATLNLRGLGSERTLVLVNGRRVVPGDPNSSAADINIIPSAVIKRVDVLTGGASSVYGSDAVAGVVNFVMDTDFEGFRLDGQYSMYQHGNDARGSVINALNARNFGFPRGSVTDGGTFDATAVFGAGFDDGRGHVTAYAGYRKIKPVLQRDRDYSACALTAASTGTVAGGGNLFTCGGSATSANGTHIINRPNPDFDPLDDDSALPFTSTLFQVGNGRNFIPGFTPYNFAPTNYYQRPDERYTLGFFADYEVSESFKPYLEGMFMDDRTVAQIAASGNFGNTFTINCDNPLLSAQQRGLICDPNNLLVAADGSTVASDINARESALRLNRDGDPTNDVVVPVVRGPMDFIDPLTGQTYNKGFDQILRRNVEGGGRRDDLQHTSYRAVIGAKGDLGSAWSYDAYYQYGRTNFAETYFNDFSVTRLTRALDVITGPDGTPICRSAQSGGDDPNCVPYDIFASGNVDPAALNYLQTPGFQRGINSESVLSASLTGQLGKYGIQMPWTDEGVGIAFGGEYRKESLDFFSDVAFQTGDLAGQGAPTLPVAGSFDVREAFAEVRVPVVHDNFIYDLAFTGGYRYSDYKVKGANNSFSTDAYKIQAEFAPIRDVRFRAGYNRAVRAPTVQDLFAPQRVVLDGTTDPCAKKDAQGNPVAITAADLGCLAQGLSVGQVVASNPAEQYNGLIGGNLNLEPEVSDTYTVGVILQPSFLPRLALSVDYFNIKLDKAISTIGADTILNVCGQTQDPFFCGLIQRDQFGSLWRSNDGFVIDTTQNIGGLKTAGIDVNGSYNQSIGNLGSLGLTFVGTWLDKLVTDTGVSGTYDCVGLYGNVCGTPNPEWRHTARLSWNGPSGIGASLRWRYFSHVDLDATSSNPNLTGATQPANLKIPSQSYFDLALTFAVGDHYNFRLGANNILDKDPPLVGAQACPAGICNGNTYSQVYDALGRYIYAGITLDF
ncbi:TonB-dependent receptor domain-containing protein [Allosphingosinicella humi]